VVSIERETPPPDVAERLDVPADEPSVVHRENHYFIVGHVAVMRSQGEDAVKLWQRQSGADASTIAVLARLFVVREARRHAVGEHLTRAAMEHADRENFAWCWT
jgi:ribosomal protein S18 acetylase RimI-like enzyme